MKDFLPIGTVVKINKGLFMITGYFTYVYSGGIKKYDYSVCEYPYGVNVNNTVEGINSEEILSVINMGYKDSSFEKYKNEVNGIEMNSSISKASTSFDIVFDENGVVVADSTEKLIEDQKYLDLIKNPFKKEIKEKKELEEVSSESSGWPIFKDIKFDEMGNVVSAEEYGIIKDNIPSDIKFDSNGVVISDGTSTLEPTNDIKFDSNGVVISDGTNTLEPTNDIKFDSNGVVISDGTNTLEPANDIKFDSNGVVISDGTNTLEEPKPDKANVNWDNISYDNV